MNAFRFFAPALALLLFTPAFAEEEKVLLRHHWEPGKVYRFDLNIDVEIGGFGGDQISALVMQVDVTVRKEAGTGAKHAELSIASLKGVFDHDGKLTTYDSASPAMSDPDIQQELGFLKDARCSLVYDEHDAFKEIVVPEEVILPEQDDDLGAQELAATFREIVEHGLPGKPLARGETATHEHSFIFTGGVFSSRDNARFDSIVDHEGRKHARILGVGAYTVPEEADVFLPRIKRETLFDLQRRVVTHSTLGIDVKGPDVGLTFFKLTGVANLKSITDAPAAKK